MSIDTNIDGDPESIRRSAHWLRRTLSESVHDCTTGLYAARTDTEPDWTGDAGDSFRERITSGARSADWISADAKKAAEHFDGFADDLHTAQIRMERARNIARAGGVTVQGTTILDPGPAPADPGDLPTDADANRRAAHDTALAAQDAHTEKVKAYDEATTEASAAKQEFDIRKTLHKNFLYEINDKPAFHASFLADGLFAGYSANRAADKAFAAKCQRIVATRMATSVLGEPYLGQPYSDTGRALNAADKARHATKNAGSWLRTAKNVGGKVPVLGLGITAVSVGYDVAAGDTPAGKAIVVNGASFGASIAAGAAIGSVVPVGGTVVGAIGGAAVGFVASGVAGSAWDAMASTEVGGAVTDGINSGFSAVGDAAESTADTAVDGAKKAWDAVF